MFHAYLAYGQRCPEAGSSIRERTSEQRLASVRPAGCSAGLGQGRAHEAWTVAGWANATLGAVLLAAATGGVTSELIIAGSDSAASPPVTAPAERAAALGLPTPTRHALRPTDVCTAALDLPDLAPACFPTEAQANRFMAGNSTDQAHHRQTIRLSGAGGGGTEVSPYYSTSNPRIAVTCWTGSGGS